MKYGLTSDLTLAITINPDFGQVGADPAQVNLSALEAFLPERRRVVLEGASIFNFSVAVGDRDMANESSSIRDEWAGLLKAGRWVRGRGRQNHNSRRLDAVGENGGRVDFRHGFGG